MFARAQLVFCLYLMRCTSYESAQARSVPLAALPPGHGHSKGQQRLEVLGM